MWTAVWHALVCSLAGAALAALLGAAWQLVYGIALLGEATFDAVEIGAIAVLAAVTTGLAGGVLSAAYQFRLRQLQARVAVAASAPGRPKRRRARLRALKLFANRTTQVQHAEELRRGRLEADTLRRRLHRVSADLQGLKKSYRELYDNAPVMYFRLDVEGRLVAFNDTLMRTLGYRREELARHSYVELLEPVAGKPATLPRGQVPFEGGEAETRWRKKNGDVFNVWISSVPVLDGEGGVVRYRSAALDLTEKNRLANELRARGDQLERANDRLRAINAELEGFTYVVSHDLKEPLRTLQTYGNALAEEYSQQLGADGFQYINHVIRASRRLGLLIDDLLNLSQAGRIARSAQSFDLIEAVATARQDLTDLIQRKDATVRTDGSLPRVAGDRHRITQLLTNLIANGLKYNQSPQPLVLIAATSAAGGAGEIVVSVRDNGIGIDPAYHDQIFGMFRRLHQPDEYEGTGAGLAICKKIVEAHGGRIWVESQPAQGAAFFFTLPDVRGQNQSAAAPSGVLPKPSDDGIPKFSPPRARPARPPAGPATGPRIVLVEDDSDQAATVLRQSRFGGLSFTWFSNAEDAWEYLQEHRPDLMLFDIELPPGMNGVELCRLVRTLPALRDTPVALFTRDRDERRLAELRAAGANFFLSKDLLPNTPVWQQRLQQILDQSRHPAKAEAGAPE